MSSLVTRAVDITYVNIPLDPTSKNEVMLTGRCVERIAKELE